jgi:hypothetical protein
MARPNLRRDRDPIIRSRLGGQFPIIIAEWPRSDGELVRVSPDRVKTCFTIDIRCWWRDTNGVFKRGRFGLTLPTAHLPKLFNGLRGALERAQMFGLVEPGGKIRGEPGDRR